MAVNKEISEAAKKIVQGVCVISTVHEGRVNAMTAAWVSRVSFVPPLVMVAVGPTRFTHDMIRDSGVFAVNILGPDNVETGRHFGLKTGRRTDKFAGVDYDTGVTGSPVLRDCVAWLDCRVYWQKEAGDHTVFIGEILDGGVTGETAALVYDREEFFR
ncbi:MAG: flavin reductase family protein [Thermodesulfobacteriota bacterium]